MDTSKPQGRPDLPSSESVADRVTELYSSDRYMVEESLGMMIKRAHQSLLRSVDERMQAYDLTAMQWGPLFLVAKGYDTVAGCARLSNSDSSSMTRMLDRLETKGLIRRIRSATDRRVVNIELTEAGRKLADIIPRELAHVLQQHLRGFSIDEYETLKNLLRRFEQNGDVPSDPT